MDNGEKKTERRRKSTKGNGWTLVLGVLTDANDKSEKGRGWFIPLDEIDMGNAFSEEESNEIFNETPNLYIFSIESGRRIHLDQTGSPIRACRDFNELYEHVFMAAERNKRNEPACKIVRNFLDELYSWSQDGTPMALRMNYCRDRKGQEW